MGLAPVDDVVIVVVGGDGAAHDQKQHLRQRMGDAPSLAWVRHGAEVVQQAASVRVGEHVHLGFPIRRENPSQAQNRYLLIAVNLTSLPWPTGRASNPRNSLPLVAQSLQGRP